jgi:hypothetical protein
MLLCTYKLNTLEQDIIEDQINADMHEDIEDYLYSVYLDSIRDEN